AASGGLSLAIAGWMGSSLLGFAWVVCICMYLVRAATGILFVQRVICIPLQNVAKALCGGLFLGALELTTAGTLNAGMAAWASWPRLLLSWGAGLSAIIAAILFFPRDRKSTRLNSSH